MRLAGVRSAAGVAAVVDGWAWALFGIGALAVLCTTGVVVWRLLRRDRILKGVVAGELEAEHQERVQEAVDAGGVELRDQLHDLGGGER